MKKNRFLSLLALMLTSVTAAVTNARAGGEWSIDFAELSQSVSGNATVTVSSEVVATIDDTNMSTCSLNGNEWNSNFVVQTGSSWLLRNRQGGLYQFSGGARYIGMLDCKAGQTITIVSSDGPSSWTNVSQTESNYDDGKSTTVYTVTAAGNVKFQIARSSYIYSVSVANTPKAPYYAVYDSENSTLTFRKDDNMPDENAWALNSNYNTPGWNSVINSVTKVIFDASFADVRPTSCYYWFADGWNISSIEGLEYLNTSETTNMAWMFSNCSLSEFDLSKLDTKNVTDMSGMFSNFSALTSLDLSKLNTENVTSMSNMFSYSWQLTSLDLSKLNTENVTNMSYMFSGCSSLTSLDLSKFDTKNVTSMGGMFSGCSALTGLDLSNFNTENVTYMGSMFSYCSALTSLDLSKFDTKNVTDMGGMFSGCSALTGLDLSNFNTQKLWYMSYMFANCSALTSLNLSSFDMQNVNYTEGMFQGCSALESLDLKFNMQNLYGMQYMFQGCSSLKTIDLSKVNTTNVRSMEGLFQDCSSLTSLDLSGFVTQNVGDMANMFYGCSNLAEVKIRSRFTTDNVGYSDNMFYGTGFSNYDESIIDKEGVERYCTRVPEPYAVYDSETQTLTFKYGLDMPSENAWPVNVGTQMPDWYYSVGNSVQKVVFDASFADARPTTCYDWFYGFNNLTSVEGLEYLNTSEVTNMGSMFSNCYALTSLDLSKFDTKNVNYMYDMFFGCSSLTSLDLSNFNTENVKNMSSMFYGCSALTSLDLSKFDTKNVTNMGSMFSSCSALTSLDLSNFNTENVTNMGTMFAFCYALTSLNLSKFNTENVTNMYYMFGNCSALTSLNLSNFNTQKVTDMRYMFRNCYALTSLDLRSFNTQNVIYMNYMFYYAYSLSEVEITKRFVTDQLYSSLRMFYRTGFSNYDANFTDQAGVPLYCTMYYDLSVADFADADKWSLSDTIAKAGQTVSVTYAGSLKVQGLQAVNKDDATAVTTGAWDAETKAGTFEMQAYEMEVKAVYYPVATVTTTPTGIDVYATGAEQTLVSGGAADGGTLCYALGTDAETAPADGYTSAEPKATAPATYYIWYYVAGDDTHNNSDTACVTAQINGFPVVVAPGEYSTYYSDQALKIEASTADDAQLYTVTAVADNSVTVTKLSVAAAGTPLLVYNASDVEKTVILIPTDDAADDVTVAAEFKGTLEGKTFTAEDMQSADYYVCNGHDFVWVKGAGTIAANRCWLEIAASATAARRLTINFGEPVTGIEAVNIEENNADIYYDLNGRRTAQPAKGLYLRNGRKVLVK